MHDRTVESSNIDSILRDSDMARRRVLVTGCLISRLKRPLLGVSLQCCRRTTAVLILFRLEVLLRLHGAMTVWMKSANMAIVSESVPSMVSAITRRAVMSDSLLRVCGGSSLKGAQMILVLVFY